MPYTSSPTTRRTTVPSFLTGVCFTVCVQTCELAAVFELRKKKSEGLASGYPSSYGGQALGHYSRWAPQTSSSRFTRPQLYL